MTYKLLIFTTVITVFLSGCAKKAPDLDGSNNISDANSIAGDTVSIDESSYGNESEGSFNSSADRFRSVYFDFGNYVISSQMEAAMNNNIKIAMASSSKIKIEGNCDEFGTDEYNYALGLKRAKAVKDSLVSQGLSSGQTLLVSLGESSPVCTDPTDSCYDRNRRVDIRLVK